MAAMRRRENIRPTSSYENVRLFRRHPEIYFTGRVHETVGWRIQETRKKLRAANFCIHHFGMASDEQTLARKITSTAIWAA